MKKNTLIHFGCICLGILIGITISFCMFDYRTSLKKYFQKGLHPKDVNPAETARRLFPDMSLADIYKSEEVLNIVRDPGSVMVCRRSTADRALLLGGFQFAEDGDITTPAYAAILSDCFRSMNAFEVGLGYPCTFNPIFLIRFRSKSGSDVVDFLCGKDCYLIDWYFNAKPINGSVNRIKLSVIGKTIVESIFNDIYGERISANGITNTTEWDR